MVKVIGGSRAAWIGQTSQIEEALSTSPHGWGVVYKIKINGEMTLWSAKNLELALDGLERILEKLDETQKRKS